MGGCLGTKAKREILLVGLDQAGKTQTLYWLKYREKMTTMPTVGFNVETVDHKGTVMTFWDLAGQDRVRSLWAQHFASVDALVFIVDSVDRERINEAKQELWKILKDSRLRKEAVLLVLANKQDLNGSMTSEEVQSALDLPSIDDRPWFCVGTCASDGNGMNSALDWLGYQWGNKAAKRN
jgi:small GTP-binding protein